MCSFHSQVISFPLDCMSVVVVQKDREKEKEDIKSWKVFLSFTFHDERNIIHSNVEDDHLTNSMISWYSCFPSVFVWLNLQFGYFHKISFINIFNPTLFSFKFVIIFIKTCRYNAVSVELTFNASAIELPPESPILLLSLKWYIKLFYSTILSFQYFIVLNQIILHSSKIV